MTCSVTARLSVGSPLRSSRDRRMRYDSARAGSEPGSAPEWAPEWAGVTSSRGGRGSRHHLYRVGRVRGTGRINWAGFWIRESPPGPHVCQPFTSKLSAGPGSVSERNPVEPDGDSRRLRQPDRTPGLCARRLAAWRADNITSISHAERSTHG